MYVFDCLLILFDEKLGDSEALLALEAEKNGIPHVFLCSKADEIIQNKVDDAGYDIYGTVPNEILEKLKLQLVDEVVTQVHTYS